MSSLPTNGVLELANNPTFSVFAAALEALRDCAAEAPGGSAEESLTCSSDAVTPTVAAFKVDGEGAAADDLKSIATTNMTAGRVVRVRAADSAHVITLKHAAGGGNLALRDAVDVKLESTSDFVDFMLIGSVWTEVARSIRNRLDRVVDFTSNQTLVGSDSGKIITNRGASGDLNHTLPTPVAGMRFRFRCVTANKIKATAAGGATIRNGATVSASNGNTESTAVIGKYFELEALNSSEWWVVATNDTLTTT